MRIDFKKMYISKKSKTKKIFIILSSILILTLTSNLASAATGDLTEEEIQFMNDAKESINMVMTVLWIAVAIVLGLIIVLILICYLLLSNTKKYLQRVDKLIGVRQSQRYGNWQNHNAYEKY